MFDFWCGYVEILYWGGELDFFLGGEVFNFLVVCRFVLFSNMVMDDDYRMDVENVLLGLY